MNKTRRKQIQECIKLLTSVSSKLETIRDDEDEYRDAMPENLQDSDRYDSSEESSNKIDDAINLIYDAVDLLTGAL